MSIWDYVFDSDWKQRSDIEALRRASLDRTYRDRRDAAGQRDDIESLEQRVSELEDDLGQATLFVMATMEMLKQTGNWDNDTFCAAMTAIDQRDGLQDGKANFDP
jgi:hypothetical protein